MISPLLLICAWVVLAFAMAAFPSNDNHWRRAYVLMALGVPLLIWVTWQSGPLMGLLGLVIGGLVFRWPLLFFWRWLRQRFSQ
jgi:uncharacterized membrane protein